MNNIDEILKENKSKKEPFSVPDGYFEDFEKRLNAKIDSLEAEKRASVLQQTKGQRIWMTLKPIVYVAAAIMILYGVTYVIIQPKVTNAVNNSVQTANRNEVNKAIQEYEDYYKFFVEDDIEGEDIMEYCSIE